MTRRAGIAVVTVSDGVAAGTRTDTSGAAIRDWAEARGSAMVEYLVVADDRDALTCELERLADDVDVDVIITTGGTGLTFRDITPEATAAVIHRSLPGIAERMRSVGTASTPYAALSRGLAGARGATLIVNLPGSTGGVRDGLVVLDEVVDHASQLLRGISTDRHEPPDSGTNG
jgi:molybdopterin adenylyltransferase